MVVIFAPAAAAAGMEQERVAAPSISTVQAPHWPSPQPYFVPVRSKPVAQDGEQGLFRGCIHLILFAIDV